MEFLFYRFTVYCFLFLQQRTLAANHLSPAVVMPIFRDGITIRRRGAASCLFGEDVRRTTIISTPKKNVCRLAKGLKVCFLFFEQ